MKTIRNRIVIPTLLGILGLPLAAQAQVNWSNAVGGNFATGSNWTGGTAPNSTQTANFNVAGTYGVSFTNAAITGNLNTGNGILLFNLGGNTYSVVNTIGLGTVVGSNGSLSIENGSLVTGNFTDVGVLGTAVLNIGSGGNLSTRRLSIALNNGATGQVNVANGGHLQVFGSTLIGANTGVGAGSLSVSGSGSVGDLFDGLTVGTSSSTGSVAIFDGGLLNTRNSVSVLNG